MASHAAAPTEQPPFVPPPEPDPAMPADRPGHLNDIGQWLKQTFKVGLLKLIPCSVLIVLGLVPAVFFYAVVFLALSQVSVDGAGGVEGFGASMFFILALLAVAWMLWSGVVTLAQNHLLYQAHVGRPTSIGQSVQAGVQGLGRLVWAYLTLIAYMVMVFGVVGGVTFVFSLVSATLGSIFFVVAYLAALVLTVWLGVKLIFLLVAAAVAPRGERPMVISVDMTDKRFWAVFGRVLLLGVIMTAALIPVMLLFGGLFGVLGSTFLDDPTSGSATALIGTVAVGAVFYVVLMLAMQVFSTSGIVRLYVDLGGPAVVPAVPAHHDTPAHHDPATHSDTTPHHDAPAAMADHDG